MLESSTAHGILVQLASLFEPEHRTVKSETLSIRHPNIVGIQTPALKASPLDLFCNAVTKIGEHRRKLNDMFLDNTQQILATPLGVFGNDVSMRVEAGALEWSVWVDSTDYEALAQTFVINGMLQQIFAEAAHLKVGRANYHVERLEVLGEAFAGDPLLWGTLLWRSPERMTEASFLTFAEDLAMLTREQVVIGLRTQWSRRVAVPIFQANKNLHGKNANPVHALEILAQCADESLARAFSTWIKANFRIEWRNEELV